MLNRVLIYDETTKFQNVRVVARICHSLSSQFAKKRRNIVHVDIEDPTIVLAVLVMRTDDLRQEHNNIDV